MHRVRIFASFCMCCFCVFGSLLLDASYLGGLLLGMCSGELYIYGNRKDKWDPYGSHKGTVYNTPREVWDKNSSAIQGKRKKNKGRQRRIWIQKVKQWAEQGYEGFEDPEEEAWTPPPAPPAAASHINSFVHEVLYNYTQAPCIRGTGESLLAAFKTISELHVCFAVLPVRGNACCVLLARGNSPTLFWVFPKWTAC